MNHPFIELVELASGPEASGERHRKVFLEWLGLTLEEQHAEVQRFLARQPDPAALVRDWLRDRSYEHLVPADVREVERDLFLCDLQIILGFFEAAG